MKELTNVAASVNQKLLNISREVNRPFNEMLQYYAMERFLYRLSQSVHTNGFVLKGALLFRVWMIPDSRATRDIDFLMHGDNSVENLSQIIREIIDTQVPDDGIEFDNDSVHAQTIKEDADYEGVRIRFDGLLGKARIRMQIDVGFGDVVHPAATKEEFPTLLDYPAPELRLYPPETVIAEKVEAMLHLGTLNSRMKDFFDVWRLTQLQAFDGVTLSTAIRQTLENRSTQSTPFGELVTELVESDGKQKQWNAFLKKSVLEAPDDFTVVLTVLEEFLDPVLHAVRSNDNFNREWKPGGPWKTYTIGAKAVMT